MENIIFRPSFAGIKISFLRLLFCKIICICSLRYSIQLETIEPTQGGYNSSENQRERSLPAGSLGPMVKFVEVAHLEAPQMSNISSSERNFCANETSSPTCRQLQEEFRRKQIRELVVGQPVTTVSDLVSPQSYITR